MHIVLHDGLSCVASMRYRDPGRFTAQALDTQHLVASCPDMQTIWTEDTSLRG